MKIVYDGSLFPGVGGGPRHYVGLAKALARQGVTVIHVLPSDCAVEPEDLVGPVEYLPCRTTHRVARQFAYEFQRALLILRWFVTGRRVDVWMARSSLFGFSFVLARLVARRTLLEVNGPVREEMRANFGSPAAARLADLMRHVQMLAADLVLPVTPGLEGYLAERGPQRPQHVLPNGADPYDAETLAKPASGLIFAGALTPWYELEVVIEALGILRDAGERVELTVIGDGRGRPSVESTIERLELEKQVSLLGWVSQETVRRKLPEGRVGILPLLEKQKGLDVCGSPLKLYEYAAAGLRVVGTDIDGVHNSPVRQIVHTYAQGDARSCAEAIRAALAAPPTLLSPDLWSWDARAQELLGLLEELPLRGRKGGRGHGDR